MKKEAVFVIFLVLILLFSNLATAYSFVGRAVDDVSIALSKGDKKAERALEAREKQRAKQPIGKKINRSLSFSDDEFGSPLDFSEDPRVSLARVETPCCLFSTGNSSDSDSDSDFDSEGDLKKVRAKSPQECFSTISPVTYLEK